MPGHICIYTATFVCTYIHTYIRTCLFLASLVVLLAIVYSTRITSSDFYRPNVTRLSIVSSTERIKRHKVIITKDIALVLNQAHRMLHA